MSYPIAAASRVATHRAGDAGRGVPGGHAEHDDDGGARPALGPITNGSGAVAFNLLDGEDEQRGRERD